MTPAAQHLEALLFVAGEAVPTDELIKILNVSAVEFSAVLAELSQHLLGHGLACVVHDRNIELITSPGVSTWLSAAAGQEELELSRAAAETLAVVAYRGPLTRYEIDIIRGVDCRQILRKLLRRGVVRRLPTRSRAPRYDVTEEFLKHVGVIRREDLPAYQEMLAHPTLLSFLKQSS